MNVNRWDLLALVFIHHAITTPSPIAGLVSLVVGAFFWLLGTGKEP